MNFSETNSEICDKNGNLLFYSNGVYIANAKDDTMLNGSGINPCMFTSVHSQYGLTIPQANLIIPLPDDSTKYYLFHESSDDYQNTYSTFYLYYSIIDMTLDSGHGAVTQKNIILLNDTLVGGRLTTCKHANGRDWWLTCHKYLNGEIIKFLITPSGIQGPYRQNVITPRDNYFGQAVFSQSGDKYAYYEPNGDLDIFDFDRCSGDFSNRIHIDINDNAAGGGAAFSPSGRFLYVTSMSYVYQFDMQATDIELSKQVIAIWDTTYSPTSPFATTFYMSQLAPDGKIYINCLNSTMALSVINNPDSIGPLCGVCQHCIQLPALNAFTIPNHPNYFLGAETGTVCDSLHIGVPEITNSSSHFSLFPNPVKNLFYVNSQKGAPPLSLKVFNSLGQDLSLNYSLLKNGEYIEINAEGLPAGVYFVEVVFEKEKVVRRFVKD